MSLAAEVGPVILDVGQLSVPEPFAMLYITCVARRLREKGVSFQLKGADRHSYAAHMGFYADFDAEFQFPQDGVRENDRYVAIRRIGRQELLHESFESFAAYVGEVIEREANRLAKLLTQMSDGPLVNALTYCLREIIRNAYEHSGAEDILVCGQFRPSSDRVDLAFADLGHGIRHTLSANPDVCVTTEREAIKVALLPGISGKKTTALRKRSRHYDPWKNTGYGLYMTHRICREGGVFTICSGDALLRLTGERAMEKDASMGGTVIGLTMQLRALAQLEQRLGQFNSEGRAMSKALRGESVTASRASLSLRMTASIEKE